MTELDHARDLLNVARRELRALKAMSDREVFANELFGFLAQQIVEKCLKAWIAALDEAYPLTHNVENLLKRLEQAGQRVENLYDLVQLTPYAVLLRYTDETEDYAPLDRAEMIAKIEALFNHVEKTTETLGACT